jgi:hypothetical protein
LSLQELSEGEGDEFVSAAPAMNVPNGRGDMRSPDGDAAGGDMREPVGCRVDLIIFAMLHGLARRLGIARSALESAFRFSVRGKVLHAGRSFKGADHLSH